MSEDSLELVREILNKWWKEEHIPEEYLKARVVSIFKKGDSSNLENYRPISLLNTFTIFFAAIIQKRISNTIDEHIQNTQYGFRKGKSAKQAIHLIRRLIDIGEKTRKTATSEETILLLLDWEKAFDRVTHEGLFRPMERMGIDEKLVRLT